MDTCLLLVIACLKAVSLPNSILPTNWLEESRPNDLKQSRYRHFVLGTVLISKHGYWRDYLFDFLDFEVGVYDTRFNEILLIFRHGSPSLLVFCDRRGVCRLPEPAGQ